LIDQRGWTRGFFYHGEISKIQACVRFLLE
jgi:hypothetical protein